MRETTSLTCMFAAVFLLSAAHADDRRPLREARSENGLFELSIRAGRPDDDSRSARGVLRELPAEGRPSRKVWTARLANDVAPCAAAIHDKGRFVVTLDEFRRGGATHALVVYDRRGKLLRDFGLRELLHGDDWKHLTIDRRAVVWLDDAEWRFTDSPPAFIVQLKWNREIQIDLRKLTVTGRSKSTKQRGRKAAEDEHGPTATAPADSIPANILALLEEAAAEAAGRTAASQPTTTTQPVATTQPAPADPTAAEVRRALENLSRLAAVSDGQLDLLNDPTAEDVLEHAGRDEMRIEGATAESAAEHGAPQLPVIPAPNPANPVDYMDWILAQTETEGPSAIPAFEAACEAMVKWEGDGDLFDRALEGDPEALASPEVGAWLEANRDALANFRSALDYEYHGWLTPSEDGTVIGILLPNLSNMRQLARTSMIEAHTFEARGDYESAFGIYADTFASGTQISQGPTLIENLVGIAVQALSAENLLDTLAADQEGVDYGALAEQLEASYQPTRPAATALNLERAMMFDVLQRMYVHDEPSGETFADPFAVRDGMNVLGGLLGADGMTKPQLALPFVLGAVKLETAVATTNELYDDMVADASKPYREAMDGLDELEARVNDPATLMKNPLIGGLVPSISRVVQVETKGEAIRRATILTARLKAYRQQHGAYPESLEVFGDREISVDPFTGGRFAYQRDGDGFRLYSLGGNGVDDGGVHDRRADENDYVFWPRPAKE